MSRDVKAGTDGWLFLVGGEHRVIDLFREESAFTAENAEAWVALLRKRSEELTPRGIKYVHIAVPDKLTLLNRHYAESLQNTDGSPIRQLQAGYGDQIPAFLNVVNYLSQGIDKYPVFWKTDNHWTAWGCFMAYQMVCARLQIEGNPDLLHYPYSESETVLKLADSVDPASAEHIQPETVRTYRLDRHSRRVYANAAVRYRDNLNLDYLAQREVENASEENIDANRKIAEKMLEGQGCHVVYENNSETAIDKKIVIFGDSYSDFRSNLLTAMLAETVKEVHFIWSESIDHEYVRQVRADIVITQSSEASMTKVPVDTGNVRDWGAARLESYEAAVKEAEQRSWEFVTPAIPGVMTRRLPMLGEELYDLNPPILVQDGCDMTHQELAMRTNPVTMVELEKARLFFSGKKLLMRAANGLEVIKYGVPTEQESSLFRQDYQRLAGTSFLLAPTPGAHCYYHWMLDVLPKLGLLERQGISLDTIDHFIVREITSEFQRETLARLGIGSDRIVEARKQNFRYCDRLLHIDMDTGINLKMNRFIPLWLNQVFSNQPEDQDRLKLYIGRPEGIRRGILNEAELKPLLEAAGFTMVVMEGMSVLEQAALLSRADALMAPHGGALTNMVFCKPGIPVIELLSRHVYPYYYGLASLCGHRYHAILENPEADFPKLVNRRIAQASSDEGLQWKTQQQSYNVDLDVVERMLSKFS